MARDNASASNAYNGLYPLSNDPEFHFELLRVLGLASYGGSDISETLLAANEIIPKDFESFSGAFYQLATRVLMAGKVISPIEHAVSFRDTMFRAATYFRAADFFLHGNWSDPRINKFWTQALTAFDSAVALIPIPAERVNIKTRDFTIPAIFYSCGWSGRRPILIIGNGYDGSQEESYHLFVIAALERGFHAITYEGPGQPTVRRTQSLGFIPDWEQVVTPVVDFVLTRCEVASDSIGLLGFSFGGYLAPRAAAFEHRLAAVLAVDGLYDFGKAAHSQFGPLATSIQAGDAQVVNYAIDRLLANSSTPSATRWVIQQGMWAFKASTPYQWLVQAPAYSLEGLVGNITAPVFVGAAESDVFAPGQAKQLADELGAKATYHLFTDAEGAGTTRPTGLQRLQDQVVMDWFQDIVGRRRH